MVRGRAHLLLAIWLRVMDRAGMLAHDDELSRGSTPERWTASGWRERASGPHVLPSSSATFTSSLHLRMQTLSCPSSPAASPLHTLAMFELGPGEQAPRLLPGLPTLWLP
jgi:hypothetical protein